MTMVNQLLTRLNQYCPTLSQPSGMTTQTTTTSSQVKAFAFTLSYPDHSHQLFHCIGTLVECGLLFRGEFNLDDLFDAFRS